MLEQLRKDGADVNFQDQILGMDSAWTQHGLTDPFVTLFLADFPNGILDPCDIVLHIKSQSLLSLSCHFEHRTRKATHPSSSRCRTVTQRQPRGCWTTTPTSMPGTLGAELRSLTLERESCRSSCSSTAPIERPRLLVKTISICKSSRSKRCQQNLALEKR